ncbi:MAG: hypothetical protein PHV02_07695 [Rhodocyclaceae bacterium]|nr:hypothetical protein [Rhodocyclaceae bacterium]
MRKLLRCCWLLLVIPCGAMAEELHTLKLNADFQIARESVREAIEGAGLVVTAVIPLNQMLERTAGDLGKGKSPFVELETIQFCSARLAWELVEESAAQVAFCPLSLTVFSQPGVPGSVISWRSPGRKSPARIRGDDLLRELAAESRLLAD